MLHKTYVVKLFDSVRKIIRVIGELSVYDINSNPERHWEYLNVL